MRNGNQTDLEERVRKYWGNRASGFGVTRENELRDEEIGSRWLSVFEEHFPVKSEPLDILDIGTGAGYFAILLEQQGHRTIGIDLTPEMITEARELAKKQNSDAQFEVMNALELDFPDNSFDAIVTRNLTWTLPDVEKAYQEWHRVLRPGGVLINFDANYADNVRYEQTHLSVPSQDTVYGHPQFTEEMRRENASITLSMDASRHLRPSWDLELFEQCGFTAFGADLTAGKQIMGQWDQVTSPMFLLWAQKSVSARDGAAIVQPGRAFLSEYLSEVAD